MIETLQFTVVVDSDLMKDKIRSSAVEITELQKELFRELTEWEGVLCVSSQRLEELDLWKFNYVS